MPRKHRTEARKSNSTPASRVWTDTIISLAIAADFDLRTVAGVIGSAPTSLWYRCNNAYAYERWTGLRRHALVERNLASDRRSHWRARFNGMGIDWRAFRPDDPAFWFVFRMRRGHLVRAVVSMLRAEQPGIDLRTIDGVHEVLRHVARLTALTDVQRVAALGRFFYVDSSL